MTGTFTFKPGPPKDAYAFWKDKVPMSKETFNGLSDDDKVKAFVVSGLAKGDQLTAIHRSIDKALSEGLSLSSWKKDVAGTFAANGWEPLEGYRLDTIFRTNIQTSYSVGRYGQLMAAAESRPFWRYSAINDGRTRPVHRALHGHVFRYDDPIWNTIYPPNGFNCRCTVTSLSAKQMDQKGLTVESIKPGELIEPIDKKGPAIPAMPDKYFDTNPAKSYWKADTARYRADVRQMVLKEFTRACPEEFSGPCEFAETDCFKRLRRFLTDDDLTDLQTLVWTEGFRQKQGFGAWVAEILTRNEKKGDVYPVGNLPLKVLRVLEKQPRLALITLDDERMAHLARDIKQNLGKALTPDEIKDIPNQIKNGRWWKDKIKKNLLVTWVRHGGVWLKIAVELDYKLKKSNRVVNHVVSAGVVKRSDIENARDQYEEIK